MSTTAATPTKHRPRWYQYRLRSLLLLTLVVSVGLGWLTHERRKIAERREALEAMGASVGVAEVQPEWRLWVLGDDWPKYAHAVYLIGKITENTGLTHLKEMTELRHLDLNCDNGIQVNDAELVNLASLLKLEHLGFFGCTQITDAGLANLKGLPNLIELFFVSSQITDAGLLHLKGLSQLNLLILRNTKVTDAGVNELRQALPNLDIRLFHEGRISG